MEEKQAFVFDTNFIIQHKDLNAVVEKLKDDFSVYVSQVSIDERIAQQCRELKEDFKAAESCKEKYRRFATIRIIKTYEETEKMYHDGIQQNYDELFGDRIIPFSKDESTFSAVIDRANRKAPPFSSDANASDKGFKDCLLWISLLSFFKDNGETEIVFSTDDAGFLKNRDTLEKEFADFTRKPISIKPNSFYRDYIDTPRSEKTDTPPITIPDIDAIRESIKSTMESICTIVVENDFGDENWYKSFTTTQKFDRECTSAAFTNMGKVVSEHLFETTVAASVVFSANQGLVDKDVEIPIGCIEKALKLYKSVAENYPDYIDQFLDAAAKILNNNYTPYIDYSDSELPF